MFPAKYKPVSSDSHHPRCILHHDSLEHLQPTASVGDICNADKHMWTEDVVLVWQEAVPSVFSRIVGHTCKLMVLMFAFVGLGFKLHVKNVHLSSLKEADGALKALTFFFSSLF